MMKPLLISAGIVLALFLAYFSFTGSPATPDPAVLNTQGHPSGEKGERTTGTYGITGEQHVSGQSSNVPESGDHIVVVDNSPVGELPSDEAAEKVGNMLASNPEEGVSVLRWALFQSTYPAEAKLDILNEALPKLSASEANALTRNLLERNLDPILFERSLEFQSSVHTKQNMSALVSELNTTTKDSQLRNILGQFAREKGFDVE